MADDAGLKPVKYAQIVAALRRSIADGTYPPGSQLPSETQLIEQFGVSRPTVVRALEQLKLAGEIDREHGRGSFVKAGQDPPLPENLAALIGSVDNPAPPGSLAQALREVTANLDAYIERRAQELATPHIEAAEREIREVRRQAASEKQRLDDLVAELRRQVEGLERRANGGT